MVLSLVVQITSFNFGERKKPPPCRIQLNLKNMCYKQTPTFPRATPVHYITKGKKVYSECHTLFSFEEIKHSDVLKDDFTSPVQGTVKLIGRKKLMTKKKTTQKRREGGGTIFGTVKRLCTCHSRRLDFE